MPSTKRWVNRCVCNHAGGVGGAMGRCQRRSEGEGEEAGVRTIPGDLTETFLDEVFECPREGCPSALSAQTEKESQAYERSVVHIMDIKSTNTQTKRGTHIHWVWMWVCVCGGLITCHCHRT